MKIEDLYKLFVASEGVSTDTRSLKKNTLFFALKGTTFNGNQFAAQALNEGCQYAVVDEEEYAANEQIILVDSVLQTLQDLANFHRKQFSIPVLGITGSNGKTTTKELVGAVLSQKYNLLITAGNLNNHLGVPFTLLRLNKNHEFAVIEMGANKPGDIKELVEIAEPTHGMITNVGAAHIEGFGSLQGVIDTKTEMYRFIEETNGVTFVNCEDSVLIEKLPKTDLFTYGQDHGDVQGELKSMSPFVNFSWLTGGYTSDTIKTNLVGRYNFTNFLSAVAIGEYFEVDRSAINAALENYTPSNNRSQVQKTDKNTLIVDCYNANPTSMNAALAGLIEMDGANKIAILGDMLELGDISDAEHQKIADFLAKQAVKVYLVGAEFMKVTTQFPTFESCQQLLASGALEKISDALVLLKGSRGIKLEQLIEKL